MRGRQGSDTSDEMNADRWSPNRRPVADVSELDIMSVQKNLPPLAPDGLPHFGFVKLPQILAVIPLSRAGFLNKVSTGVYPRPYKISARAVAWKVEDIRAILATFVQITPDTIDKNVAKAIAHRHLSKRAQELV